MIIISEKIDLFSTQVEDWLRFNKRDCFRINAEEPVRGINIKIQNGNCEIGVLRDKDADEIQLTNHRIWHRRGMISFSMPTEQQDIDDKFLSFLSREAKALFNGILLMLDSNGLLVGRHVEDKGNKLYHLFIASRNGFNVPNTFVTNCKEKLLQICSQNPKLILNQ